MNRSGFVLVFVLVLNAMAKMDPTGSLATITKLGMDATVAFSRKNELIRAAYQDVNLGNCETVAERELIAAYVSGLNQCQFCHGAHSAVAAGLGVDMALFGALLDDPDQAPVDEKLKGCECPDQLQPHGRIRSEVPPMILTHRHTILMSFHHTPS